LGAGCTVANMLESRRPGAYERLIQGGIPPRSARRILREFAEHLADLVAEQGALGLGDADARTLASERLGSEEELVAGALARPELKCWSRRRPCTAFAVMPLLALAGAFVLSIVALIGFFEWRKARGDSLSAASPLIRGLTEGASIYLLWALPVAVAAAIALLAARRREASIWPMVGIALTCIVGAMTNLSFDLPPLAPDPGMTAGFGLSADNLESALMRAASAAALTALPYLWVRRYDHACSI
jgi:hypothetical protein